LPTQRLNAVGEYAQDAYSLGVRTWNGLNAIRKLINIEFKRFDVNANGASTSQAGVVSQLSQIAQGTDNGQRVGNSLRCQHLRFCAHVLINGSATRSAVRIIIVRDLENAGSAPAGSDILVSAGGSNCVTSNYLYTSHGIGTLPGRFTILFDETVTMSVTGEQNCLVKCELPMTQHIRYSGSAGASTKEGSLWVAAFCNEATNTATLDWNANLTYTDD
jgi:hypothetical protein